MAKTLAQMLEEALEVARALEDTLADYEELIDEFNEEIERLDDEVKQFQLQLKKKEKIL